MNDESTGTQGSGRGLIAVISWHWPGGTEENCDNAVMRAGISVKIRTVNLPKRSLECYRFANQLCE
jgi:hypothetical protein